MSLRHGSRNRRTLRLHAAVRCARCGLPIEHRAVAAPFYGSAGRTGTIVTARMSGGSCCCVRPEPLASDPAGVGTT